MKEHARNGIENVIFDIGGVILDVDFKPAAEVFAKECGVTPREILQTVFPSRELEQYDRGRIEPGEFFRHLRSRFKIQLDEDALRRLWDDIFRENVPVAKLIRGWHGRLPMYLISNTCRSHVEQFESQFDLFGLFKNRRAAVTTQWPEEPRPLASRFRSRHLTRTF